MKVAHIYVCNLLCGILMPHQLSSKAVESKIKHESILGSNSDLQTKPTRSM
jgi:hypothetical protein